ncbi:hypothetical protein NQ317_012559 [Molorchus minor]|uniref:H15 domain-containing protein n=1 Tax=Molorchus minor TaxID=1323400 RepID=A0ABQ9K3B1_9CUCU|nr:hypothetical protein NQ317_012559 [Molorchus minor]
MALPLVKTIGGSQGKFRPRPKDVWLKMKVAGKQPRLLPDVMQAIVDLREGSGSTQHKILEHIQSVINSKKITPRPRNVTMQVRRAIKHGVANGLLTSRGGKFQLGIRPKDFAVYKMFRNMEPLSDCNQCKRRGRGRRRGRRGRRRRRRRRRAMGDGPPDSETSPKDLPEPLEGRRRRRRGRKGRRRRRRGRRRSIGRGSKECSSGTDHRNGGSRSSKDVIGDPSNLACYILVRCLPHLGGVVRNYSCAGSWGPHGPNDLINNKHFLFSIFKLPFNF